MYNKIMISVAVLTVLCGANSTIANSNSLHEAAKKGDVAEVRQLLTQEANVNATDQEGWTPLAIAAYQGYEIVVQLLIKAGARVNATRQLGGQTALFLAARNGHEAVVRLLIDEGAKVNATDENGCSPLMFAAQNGHEAVVQLLIAVGADVNAANQKGWTVLMGAALNGHEAIARLLISAGATVNATHQRGQTALYIAAQDGHEAVARLLIDAGANVNATNQRGQTALYMVAVKGHEAVARLLIKAGANVNATHQLGSTALMIAARNGREVVVQLLIEAGARVNATSQRGWTALRMAAQKGHEAVVRQLISAGAKVNATDENGWSPLMFAAWNGHLGVVKILIDAGADVKAAAEENGLTPLMFAARDGHLEVVEYLLKAGADVHTHCQKGLTAKDMAVQNGHTRVVKVLVEADVSRVLAAEQVKSRHMKELFAAISRSDRTSLKQYLESEIDLLYRDKNGDTALLAAVKKAVEMKDSASQYIVKDLLANGRIRRSINEAGSNGVTPLMAAIADLLLVKKLLKAGADVNAVSSEGFTALYIAAQDGHAEVVGKLLRTRSEVNTRCKGGMTALHIAAQNGHLGIVKNLLRARANVGVCSKGGCTALDLAIQNGHTEVVSTLKAASDSIGNRGAGNVKGTIAQVAGDNQELTAEQVKSRRMEKLFAAISQSDLTSLRQCLKSEIDPLYKNEHGNTALIAAVKKDARAKESASQRIVRELLTRDEIRGAVNEPGSKGVTALMAAIADAEKVGFLLDGCKQNLKLDCVDEHGQTVFAHAAHSALPRVMRTLLAFAKGNIKSNELWDILTRCDHKELTATMIAARSGKYENAELLLQAIESLATLNDDREQHVSEQKEWVKQYRHSHPDAMSSIEFDEDDQKEEPAELRQTHKECIDLLRAGLWQQFNESLRAHEHVPSWIRDQVVVDGQNTTVLHLALEATDSPSQKFFKGLLSTTGGRVVNLTDDRGRQPLDLAIATGKRGLIKALLAHKAQVQARHITDIAAIVATVQNQAEQKYWQVLHDAMKNKRDAAHVAPPTEYKTKEAVATEKQSDKQKQLLAKIADKSAAFRDGWIKELLSTGFDVNEKLEQQMTLLMRAADAGSLEAVNVLLKAGANVNAKDAHGDTPFAYASRAAHTALANRLCVAMAEQGFKKKPSALGHIMQRHACKAPKSLKSRGMNVKDRPFFIEEMRTIRDNGKTMRKKCKAHQFPESWNKQKIQKAICAVLSNPQQVVDNHAEIDDSGTVVRGTLAVEGVVHGLNMRVVVSNAREAARWCVFTAYPLPSRTR